MSHHHTLAARLRDLQIELQLWMLGWVALSVVFEVVTYLVRAPFPGSWVYPQYLIARLLDRIGMGSVVVPGWYSPDWVLSVVHEHFGPRLLAQWDADLLVFAVMPLYALLVLAALGLIFSRKKDLNHA